jgi:hypothetical protein
VERVFSEEMAWRLLQAMNEQQAAGRTDVDVFPAAVAEEVGSFLIPTPSSRQWASSKKRIT